MKRFGNRHKSFILCGALCILLISTIAGAGQTKRPSLIFTEIFDPINVTNIDDCINTFRAAILVHDRNAWRIVNLPKDYENSGWQFAGRSKTGKDIWAFAEYAVEGRGWDLETAYSADDGRTWRHIGALKKISYLAEFYSFTMSGTKAELTVQLSDGVDSTNKDGYYTYTSTNKGVTWSKTPKYSTTPPPEGKNSIEKLPLAGESIGRRCSDLAN